MSTTSQDLAPIAFLAYKRPLTTLQALYTLGRCPEAASSELFIFCDAPRRDTDRRDVQLTRELVARYSPCERTVIIEAERNLGLARSIISAVSRLCASHGRVIVLEDDLLASRGLLAYMNEALRRYAQNERVMTVSAHALDCGVPESRAVLLPLTTTWGWATWARAWSHFQETPTDVARLRDARFRRHFNLDGAYDYATMLERQLAGQIDSWGIRWWWTVHGRDGLGVFPRQSLVTNIGAGIGATHTLEHDPMLSPKSFDLDNEIHSWPSSETVDVAAFADWRHSLRELGPTRTWASRVRRFAGRGATVLRRPFGG